MVYRTITSTAIPPSYSDAPLFGAVPVSRRAVPQRPRYFFSPSRSTASQVLKIPHRKSFPVRMFLELYPIVG